MSVLQPGVSGRGMMHGALILRACGHVILHSSSFSCTRCFSGGGVGRGALWCVRKSE